MSAIDTLAGSALAKIIAGLERPNGDGARPAIVPAAKSSLIIEYGDPDDFANEVIYERETINDFLCRGETTIILAQPATGKTGLALTYMMAICAERPDIAGEKTLDHTGAVIYVAGERSASVKRRWAALLKRHGLNSGRLPHKPIFIRDPKGVKVVRSEDGRGGGRIVLTEKGEEIRDLIAARGDVALVIYDTQMAVFEGMPENANEAIGQAYVRLDEMSEQLNVATAVLHHMPKANGRTGGAGDMLSARGAGAGVAAVGNVITLTELDRDDNAKLPPHLRNRVIRLDGAKCNEAEWAKRRHFSRDGELINTVNRKTGQPGKPSKGAILVPEQINFGWQPNSRNGRLDVLTAVRDAADAKTPLRTKGATEKPAGVSVLAKRFNAKPDAMKETFDALQTEGLLAVVDSAPADKASKHKDRTHKVWSITDAGEEFLKKAADEVFAEVSEDE